MPNDDERDRIDVLAEEFAERCRRGERPSVSEYEARHPECADQIRELLPSVALIEQLKRQKRRTSGPGGEVPAQMGDFRIVREVGRGGMGVVYEAEQVSLGRRVALKVLPQHSHLDPKRIGRFQHEAQAAGRLHHTNIVPVLGVGEFEGLHYYVMPFVAGRGLDQVRAEWKSGTDGAGQAVSPPAGDARWREVARLGAQAAEALQYAHEQGVLHRDVKPANLLLDQLGVLWVADFGLAKLGERSGLTQTGDIIGTLQYMAPEQFSGQADSRSDVYSLGLTLYELVTLEPGFQDSNPSRLIQRVSEDQPARPRKVNPAIPLDLETIILKAIAREPAHRYPTARELADDLRRFLEDRPVRARRVRAPERLWRWCRRNRAVATLSATAAVAVVFALAAGWVGYATASQALASEKTALGNEKKRRDEAEKATQRADENVALSLAAIADLLNKIAPNDFAPGPRERGDHPDHPDGPPPRGPHGHPPPEPEGPDDDFSPPPGPLGGPRDGPPRGPSGGPHSFAPPPGHRRPGRPGPGGAPGRHPDDPRAPAGRTKDEAKLLQGILTFYDRFAARNRDATSARLQLDVANAFLRAGALHQHLDQAAEARAAYRRAAELYETLASRKGSGPAPDCRSELAEAYVLAAEGAETPVELRASAPGLRRAIALGEQLDADDPGAPEPADLLARAHVRLGQILEREGQPRDAETSLRRALAQAEAAQSEDDPGPFFVRFARLSARLALADFLRRHHRSADARPLYRRGAAELRGLTRAGPLPRHLARSLARQVKGLAEGLRAVGESDLADEAEAEGPDESGRGDFPGPPGRRPPPD